MRVKGGTNKLTGHTISPDQLMGDIVDSQQALIPQVVDPWGKWNELFERTLIGDQDAPPVTSYPASRRHAQRMHELACSNRVPFGLLNTANKTWKTSHSDSWYGDSYFAADPKTWALQQIGLTTTNALTAHLIAGHDKLTLPSATAKQRQTKPLLCEMGASDILVGLSQGFGQSSTAYEFRHHEPICIWNSQESPNAYGHLR
jgi:hypothetical protein